MNTFRKSIELRSLLFKNSYSYFLLFFVFILFGIQKSALDASTIYSTMIFNKDNQTELFDAIREQNVKAVKSLIAGGYDVNESVNGYTPLMVAVCKGNLKIIKFLVSAGANLESYDNQGNTPLMYAFYDQEKSEAVSFLLSLNVNAEIMNSSEQTPLILAALNNHYNSIKLLVKAGLKLETKGKSGETALMHAVGNNRKEAVEVLIKLGADPEARDDFSFTPLMKAAFNNDGAMIRTLITAGADFNARTTKAIPVNLKKDIFDHFPKQVYITTGSTALDIAKQFEKRFAEHTLLQLGGQK